jgi:hypothetical protein
MAYFKDFTVCTYFGTGDWLCRLMAIGWIERGKPFDRGDAGTGWAERIRFLRQEFRSAFPEWLFRGLHECSICGTWLEESHVNLFVPHPGFVFVAPGRIDHYMTAHRYLPPQSFLDALMACPSPRSEEYRSALRASNRGVDAPFFRA